MITINTYLIDPSPIFQKLIFELITSLLDTIDLASKTQEGFLILFATISQLISAYSGHSVSTTTASASSKELINSWT